MRKFFAQIMFLGYLLNPEWSWAENGVGNKTISPIYYFFLFCILFSMFSVILSLVFKKWYGRLDNKNSLPPGLVYVAFGFYISDLYSLVYGRPLFNLEGLLNFDQKARRMNLVYCVILIFLCAWGLFIFSAASFIFFKTASLIPGGGLLLPLGFGILAFLTFIVLAFFCFSFFYLLHPGIKKLFK